MAIRTPYWWMVALVSYWFTFKSVQQPSGEGKRQKLLTLLVTVYDQYGNRIGQAHVHLAHPASKRHWTLETDKFGRAYIPLDNGTTYSAVAEKKGFINSTKKEFQTESKSTVDTLPLMLTLR